MISIKRWFEIIIVGILAAAFVLLGLPLLHEISKSILPNYPNIYSIVFAICSLLILIVVAIPLVRAGCFRVGWRGITHVPVIVRHPPIVWSVGVGATIVIFINNYFRLSSDSHSTSRFEIFILLILYATLVACSFLLDQLNSISDKRGDRNDTDTTNIVLGDILCGTPSDTLNYLIDSPDRLFAWINSDAPITSTRQDLFGIQHIAKSMTSAIDGNDGNAIGLLGRFGSGKTSIVNLVKASFTADHANPQPLFINIKTWGVKPDTLPTHILRTGVDELRKHVDTLSIGGMPEEYARAMEAAGPSWFRMLLHGGAAKSIDQLQRLNVLAKSIGYRILFVIEDLDRNAPQEIQSHIYAGLQALLAELKHCTNLGFILTVGQTTLDFDRLCDMKVHVPLLSVDHCSAVVQAARYHLLITAVDKDLIIPDRSMLDIKAMQRTLLTGRLRWRYKSPTMMTYSALWQHILPLLTTPRRLKAALSHTERSWNALMGEVDIDQLLICEVIRASCPQVLDAIADIRSRTESDFGLIRDEAAKEFQEWLDNRLDRSLSFASIEEREHLEALAKYFIKSNHDNNIRLLYRSPTDDPIQNAVADDVYWYRLWSGYINSTEPTDQYILQHIHDWKNNRDTSTLPSLLENDGDFTEVFERIVEKRISMVPEIRIDGTDILGLASGVNKYLIAERRASACEDNSIAFIPLWRLYVNGSRAKEIDQVDWVTREITSCLSTSLRLALDIEYYWISARDAGISTHNVKKVRQYFIAHVKQLWDDQPEALCTCMTALTLSHVFSLAHLIFRGYHDKTESFSPSDWRWLLPVMFQCMTICPSSIGPATAALALGGTHNMASRSEGESWTVSAELASGKACALIPDREQRLSFFKASLASLQNADVSKSEELVQLWVKEAVITLGEWVNRGVPEITNSEVM